MTKALAVRPATDLENVPDVDAAANLVCYLGIRDLPSGLIPARAVTIDSETGEIVQEEPDSEYVNRVFPKLDHETRHMVLTLGVGKAAVYQDKLGDGIRYMVWKSWDNGWWVDLDDGPEDLDKAFRAWVTETMTQEGRSNPEASQLANTILNLQWLADNNYRGLPKDGADITTLEPIFRDAGQYQRWRRVTSRLRGLIDAKKEGAKNGEITQQIRAIIKDVNDPDKNLTDLDQVGRKKPRVPPIVMTEGPARDSLGRSLVSASLTPSQKVMLQLRLGKDLEYRLEGETYDIKDYILANYRLDTRLQRWSRRTWDDYAVEWSPFEPCDGTRGGIEDRPAFEDGELQLIYYWMWEEAR